MCQQVTERSTDAIKKWSVETLGLASQWVQLAEATTLEFIPLTRSH